MNAPPQSRPITKLKPIMDVDIVPSALCDETKRYIYLKKNRILEVRSKGSAHHPTTQNNKYIHHHTPLPPFLLALRCALLHPTGSLLLSPACL